MFNAMIVDDEKPALDVLKLLLEKTGRIRVAGSFMRAWDALSQLRSLKPDVAFLDIEMPEMSGLELAEKMMDSGMDIAIVFVTAYDKYALKAFQVNAIDYILKPFSPDDIAKAVARLEKIKPAGSPKTPADRGRIYCFGRLSVYGSGDAEAVKWRTLKAEELFAFMLQNLNKEVPKWKITQILWPECESEKLDVNLHTTVYKIKKTLLSTGIKFAFTFKNGAYKLELPDAYVDTAEFEAITKGKIELSAASVEKYKKALSLYRANYLEGNEYLWAQSKAEEYLEQYRSLVSEVVKYYAAGTDYANAEKILRSALTKAPMDDDLNEMLLKLFYIKKDKASLVMHYNKIRELYKTELGITPNAAMRDLFKRASKI